MICNEINIVITIGLNIITFYYLMFRYTSNRYTLSLLLISNCLSMLGTIPTLNICVNILIIFNYNRKTTLYNIIESFMEKQKNKKMEELDDD